MDFFDPKGAPIVTPRELVSNFSPRSGKNHRWNVDRCAILTILDSDTKWFVKRLHAIRLKSWGSYREVYKGKTKNGPVTVARSFLGAPNLVALSEELAAFGMERALFFGYCGSIQGSVKAGDIIVPTGTVREEGTSYHYVPGHIPCRPDKDILALTCQTIDRHRVPFHLGKVWSTDAIYRETNTKVTAYRERGVLGVDMELSALFGFGLSRGINVGGLLVVTDELASGVWHPMFPSPYLAQAVRRARRVALDITRSLT
jgi:uridine phosphorylase